MKPFSLPNGAKAAVTFCFDVDAEASWILDEENKKRLSLLSAGAYGRRNGVPRILNLLEKHEIPAQFFIPGYTAEIDEELVKTISEKGYPIGCHGYNHERTDTLSYKEEDIIIRSKEIVERITGQSPRGYRAPLWEITPQTIDLLVKHDFVYDSSLMGDDVPYAIMAKEKWLLEFPVTWMLDDWEQFAYSAMPQVGAVIEEPDKVLRMWKAEFEALYEEGRHFILTVHPEIIGRPSRIKMLDNLITYIKTFDGVMFCSLDALYEEWQKGTFSVDVHPY
ncbi:polysaccharide deacetylase [Fictibacillus sp. WQ 8-8]|uniref:polysaccharide deacetylase family protein n=1 Tax=Fictibacillus sp. WQ 8-8 TaxID=2938788 RepID=UPI00210AE815|nr:polysaccharide deacetylase [Fictibacillus sp. WQ 8-8]MCQ6268128.1 polysaccharide deacetylase [Fictibacillus sp. WQ 8-8]